jgi:hypothetical protein
MKHYRTMQRLNTDSTISDALRVAANELELWYRCFTVLTNKNIV